MKFALVTDSHRNWGILHTLMRMMKTTRLKWSALWSLFVSFAVLLLSWIVVSLVGIFRGGRGGATRASTSRMGRIKRPFLGQRRRMRNRRTSAIAVKLIKCREEGGNINLMMTIGNEDDDEVESCHLFWFYNYDSVPFSASLLHSLKDNSLRPLY